jgi:acryloyl-coenzyme A reductase
MKAMVVHQPGGTEVLSLERVADPTASPKDVIIKVDACGVCFHDIVTRNGTLKFGVQMPCILGHEISGTVVDIGRDVRAFQRGDRVATVQRYHLIVRDLLASRTPGKVDKCDDRNKILLKSKGILVEQSQIH